MTGVGGAGIVTLGSVLAMAAHLEGKAVSVLNVLGMAQKNGPVTSHVRISQKQDEVLAARIGRGQSDVIIGTDPVVTGSAESIDVDRQGQDAHRPERVRPGHLGLRQPSGHVLRARAHPQAPGPGRR